ncbi:MAG TPA: GAF domain-containing protein [Ktedonobacterales bacterium]|nr:GAF domain-containing protein [Ktedonobacterales bacterium]
MDAQGPEMRSASHSFHIGDVAALTGLTVDALRAWERVGLLTPRRSAGGVRRYTEDDIARVRLIARTLQSGGFSRRAIVALLESGDLRPDAADYAPGPARVRRPADRAGDAARAVRSGTRDRDEARSERRTLDSVARVGDALASGRALNEVLDVICRESCIAFGVADTVLWLAEPLAPPSGPWLTHKERAGRADGHSRALVAVAAYGPHASEAVETDASLAVPHSVPLDDLRIPAVRAFHSRRGLIINTMESSPATPRELRDALRGAALLVIPLLATSDAPLGVLVLREAHDPERFDTDDLEHVRLFAVQAALAVETARLHDEIRVAREAADVHRARWQATVDDLPALVYTCDRALNITYVSPTCARVLGWPSDGENLARPPAPWIARDGFFWHGAPTSLPPDELPLPQALHENRAVNGITVVHRCSDGRERLIAWDAAPMVNAGGELLGAVAFGRDVTEEHRRQEREACLAAVTRAAAGAPDPADAMGRAARVLTALVEHARAPITAACLYLLDTEEALLRRVGAFGTDASGTHAPAIPLTKQHPWWDLLVAGPAYSAHDRAQPRWLRAIDPATWKATSLRAWATVPLRVGDTLVGVLSVGLSTPHVWHTPERAWIEACADAVTMGIENDRLFAAERQRSRELEAALASTTSIPPDRGVDRLS